MNEEEIEVKIRAILENLNEILDHLEFLLTKSNIRKMARTKPELDRMD